MVKGALGGCLLGIFDGRKSLRNLVGEVHHRATVFEVKHDL